jgi:HD-like signal output (HDOD) protein
VSRVNSKAEGPSVLGQGSKLSSRPFVVPIVPRAHRAVCTSAMAKSKASEELRHRLVRTFENPNYRPPPLPSVATSRGNREDVDIEDVVRVLERDEMLAGAVVRLVNSPMYIGRGPIRSLREAVIRVGVRKVQEVVFEAALRGGVFNLPGYDDTMEPIRLHSTITAYLTRVVCRHARINEGNAFLCGLLHDIGFAAVLLPSPTAAAQSLRSPSYGRSSTRFMSRPPNW